MALVTPGMRQSSELLAITYGALVAQLVEDYEDPAAINEQLEKMCAAAHVLCCLVVTHCVGDPRSRSTVRVPCVAMAGATTSA